MSTIKYNKGGDLMQPAHIFKTPKRGESVVAELPKSLAGEQTLAAMKEKPIISNDVIDEIEEKIDEIIDDEKEPSEDKFKGTKHEDDNGDSPAE